MGERKKKCAVSERQKEITQPPRFLPLSPSAQHCLCLAYRDANYILTGCSLPEGQLQVKSESRCPTLCNVYHHPSIVQSGGRTDEARVTESLKPGEEDLQQSWQMQNSSSWFLKNFQEKNHNDFPSKKNHNEQGIPNIAKG
jgi:hypothetical protein